VERTIDQPEGPKTYTEQEIINESKERVWNKIESRRVFTPRYGMWRHKLSIPIPAVAAAAVIILLMTVLFFREVINAGNRDMSENSGFILAAEMDYMEDFPGFIPASADMSGVLQYLAPNSGTNIIILQLPESKDFFRAGEPAIIRAADFSRQQSGTGRRP